MALPREAIASWPAAADEAKVRREASASWPADEPQVRREASASRPADVPQVRRKARAPWPSDEVQVGDATGLCRLQRLPVVPPPLEPGEAAPEASYSIPAPSTWLAEKLHVPASYVATGPLLGRHPPLNILLASG